MRLTILIFTSEDDGDLDCLPTPAVESVIEEAEYLGCCPIPVESYDDHDDGFISSLPMPVEENILTSTPKKENQRQLAPGKHELTPDSKRQNEPSSKRNILSGMLYYAHQHRGLNTISPS